MSPATDIEPGLARRPLDHLYEFAVGAGIGAAAVASLITLVWISARHGVASSLFRYVGF
jgi:hypothetical protein